MVAKEFRYRIAPPACFFRPAALGIELEVMLPIRQRFVVCQKLFVGDRAVEQSDCVVRAFGQHFAEKFHSLSIIQRSLLLFGALKIRGSQID